MWTLIPILLIAWLVGLLLSYNFGGWIHLLPLLAVVLAIASLFGKRKRRYSRY